jgi:tryptophanyl-tRNA synthetase
MRAKRAELAANLDYVNAVLREGGQRAQKVARGVLDRAKVASGLS